jgi:hypothetical protein
MQEIRNYVRKAVEAFSRKDSDAFCSLIMLEEGDPSLQQLQNALYNVRETQQYDGCILSDESRHNWKLKISLGVWWSVCRAVLAFNTFLTSDF